MPVQRGVSGNVVVGIDGSDDSQRALDYAAALAAGLGAEVVAVRVVTGAGATAPMAMARGRRIATRTVEGHPVPALLAAAAEEGARLLVVGRRGEGGFPELIVGSTGHQVAHLSRCPVLIVPAGPTSNLPGPDAPLAVGVDGSAGSQAALQWLVPVATAYGCEAVVVHAMDLAPAFLFDAGLGDAYRAAHQAVGETVSRWCGSLREAGVPHRVVIEDSGAAQALIRAAHQNGAALLVVGSRGGGGFPGLRLGSVADQVAHYANLPVVVVPPTEPSPAPEG
jgi:nucleotide-binding universal stress UspA family protein